MLQNRTSQEFRKNLEKLRLHLSIEEKRSRKKKKKKSTRRIYNNVSIKKYKTKSTPISPQK